MALFALVLILVLVYSWPRLWYSLVEGKVDATVVLGRKEVESGGAVPVTIRVTNRAFVPCPFIQVSLQLPEGLCSSPSTHNRRFSLYTFAFMRQTVELQTEIYGACRGTHAIHEVTLKLHEGMGLRDRFMYIPVNQTISVYPDRLANSAHYRVIDSLQNEVATEERKLPDETLLRGIRPYRWGDNWRHVAWAATARRGELMTKEFQSSTERNVTLLVNVQLFDPFYYGTNHRVVDTLCSLARRTATELAATGAQLQLMTNATTPKHPKLFWHGKQRLQGIVSILGRVHPTAFMPMEGLLDAYPRLASPSSLLLIFSNFLTDKNKLQIGRLQQRGYAIQIVASAAEEVDAHG